MTKITFQNNQWIIPDSPELGYIIGDGIGTDVTPTAMNVLDAAVAKAYGGTKQIRFSKTFI